MKSFKQFIKPKFEKDSKGRYIIHHSTIGICNKNLEETFHEPTDISNEDHAKKIHSRLKQYYDNNFDENDTNSISQYGNGSFWTNNLLHNTHLKNPISNGYFEQNIVIPQIRNLDAIHNRTKPSPEDFHVYTGIKWNPEDLFSDQESSKEPKSGYKQDEDNDSVVMHLPAYTSTSLSKKVAEEFAKREDTSSIPQEGYSSLRKYIPDKHIIKIKIPKGSTHGIYIGGGLGPPKFGNLTPKQLDDIYANGEKEFLLKRGLTLKLSKTPEKHKNEHDGITHIWHGIIVGHDPVEI